jgi:hypothetical protein
LNLINNAFLCGEWKRRDQADERYKPAVTITHGERKMAKLVNSRVKDKCAM